MKNKTRTYNQNGNNINIQFAGYIIIIINFRCKSGLLFMKKFKTRQWHKQLFLIIFQFYGGGKKLINRS